MDKFNDLIYEIANFLTTQEKAYDLPSLCVKYGLAYGEEEEEALKSKRVYVQKRLKMKSG